jgi:hypothetical protein
MPSMAPVSVSIANGDEQQHEEGSANLGHRIKPAFSKTLTTDNRSNRVFEPVCFLRLSFTLPERQY